MTKVVDPYYRTQSTPMQVPSHTAFPYPYSKPLDPPYRTQSMSVQVHSNSPIPHPNSKPYPYPTQSMPWRSSTVLSRPTSKPNRPLYDDCVSYFNKDCYPRGANASSYLIKARNKYGYNMNQYCRDEKTLNGCPKCREPKCRGNGWTQVASLPLTKAAAYDSEVWTSKMSNSVTNDLFWSANVSEVCVTVKNVLEIQFSMKAPSLRSLFFEKRLINVSLASWINATNLSEQNRTDLQPITLFPQCYEIGFNVGDPKYAAARIGVVKKNITGCESLPNIGFGVGLSFSSSDYPIHGVSYVDVQTIQGYGNIYVRSRPSNNYRYPTPTPSLTPTPKAMK
ncbi:uncharacterized protein LOC124449726 isoform X2 [Xenia sp. Carnegie-2017]|nr:uncharacterized protein LOC124449726 isoform X2 [Xenia sp. Carnegie-2017]